MFDNDDAEPVAILLALDVDGVFNSFSKNRKLASSTIGDFPIRWRPDVLDRFRPILKRDDVTPVWLTTWLDEPHMLVKLEELLELEGLVPYWAESRFIRTAWGSSMNPLFEGTSDSPGSPKWWKYRALELLEERFKPKRLAFLDDDLGRARGPLLKKYWTGVTYEKFFYRTHETAGLLHEDLDKLKQWLDMPYV